MPQMEAPQALLDQIQIFFAPVQQYPLLLPASSEKNETKKRRIY